MKICQYLYMPKEFVKDELFYSELETKSGKKTEEEES